ncbi:MAG: phosphatidate cytidylyltransferase [Aristaeellaceae bacterium]
MAGSNEKMQRVVTGAVLAAAAAVLMIFGGAVMATAALVCICIAMYEEYHALKVAGNRPVAWPTWLGVVLSIPLASLGGTRVLVPLIMGVFLLTAICVMFRAQPRLEDALMSIMPLFTIALPGMCVVAMSLMQPKGLQVVLLCLAFATPCVGDMAAYAVGSRVRGPKLCPAVSPNKTISGAIAGLVGSLLTALLVGGIGYLCVSPETRLLLPSWWQYLLMGLVGGVASQMGDLWASMVKRHCGIKDFSNLFPGHGGMLDRIDSILFMSVVVFCFCVML